MYSKMERRACDLVSNTPSAHSLLSVEKELSLTAERASRAYHRKTAPLPPKLQRNEGAILRVVANVFFPGC